jgi:hypothetical protein
MKLLLLLLLMLCGCSRAPKLSPASEAAEQQDPSGLDPFGGSYGSGGAEEKRGDK